MHYNFEFEEDFTQDAEDEEALGEWKAKMEEWSSGDQGEEIWGRKIRSASTLKTVSCETLAQGCILSCLFVL